MGYPKPLLPFGPELMLQRVMRILKPLVAYRVIVAAKNQELPDLPDDVGVAFDEQDERGPLEGLRAGLKKLPKQATLAFITSCDVPLLQPRLVEHLFECCDAEDIVVPRDGRFFHPLTAVYKTSVLPEIESLLDQGQLRPRAMFDRVKTTEIDIESLRQFDEKLGSFRNLNHQSDYKQCLFESGFEFDEGIQFDAN